MPPKSDQSSVTDSPSSDGGHTSGSANDDPSNPTVCDALFDHGLAMRKSAPRGGTWKFGPNNLSVEIPLGPVTLFSDKSVSIHDTLCIAWTFKVEPVKINSTNSKSIRRERYCFGLVPESRIGEPGFLLIEDDNPCRMEGGYPIPGKLHTVMINPVEKKVHFFMENLENKVKTIDIDPALFPCRLGILAFMHQTIEIVNDLHPERFHQRVDEIRQTLRDRTQRTASGGLPKHARFLASRVHCFKSQSAKFLDELCRTGSYAIKKIKKGEILSLNAQENTAICVVYVGQIVEEWTPVGGRACIQSLCSGDIFQEIQFSSKGGSGRKYTCLEDSEILIFLKDHIASSFVGMHGHNVLYENFMEMVSEHFKQLILDSTSNPEVICGTEHKEKDGRTTFDINLTQLFTKNQEKCANLSLLSLTKCNIRLLNFSLLPKTLKKLYLGFNQIDSLEDCSFGELQRCSPSLSELFLHHNKIFKMPPASLKLSCLQKLGLDSNNLEEFNIQELPETLTHIWLSNNQIQHLDFSQLFSTCPDLALFDLSFNYVTNVEADKWPLTLQNFYISGNGITELDVSKIPPTLEILDIAGGGNITARNSGRATRFDAVLSNAIGELDFVSMKPWKNLKILDVANNKLRSIDERQIPKTCIALFASQNQLRLFSPNKLLCAPLQILDLSNNPGIGSFDCSGLHTQLAALRILNLYNCNLREFDTSTLPLLKTLWLGKNHLKSIEAKSLPRTLKILSLPSNELESLDFSNLPRDLDVLNVSKNNLKELPVRELPPNLLELEFKNNHISHFSWDEVAQHLKCLMSINFDGNEEILKAVDELKLFSMFKCILHCPNLSIETNLTNAYMQYFKPNTESLVGCDAWLREKLPVPSDETIRKNDWKVICKYLTAVARSGGADSRRTHSVVYVPFPQVSLPDRPRFDIKRTILGSVDSTPKVRVGEENDRPYYRILELSSQELCSRSIMSHQRICIITLKIPDNLEDEEVTDLKPIFSCLSSMYHSSSRVSILVLLCNSTTHETPLQLEQSFVSDIEEKLKHEVDRLNELFQNEITEIIQGTESTKREKSPISSSSASALMTPPSIDEAPQRVSALVSAILEVEERIAECRKGMEMIEKAGKVHPSNEAAALESFWEKICCDPQHKDVQNVAEQLWHLYRKLNRLKARQLIFMRNSRLLTDSRDSGMRRISQSDRKQPKQTRSFLQLCGVIDAFESDKIRSILDREVQKRNETVPAFYDMIKELVKSLEQFKGPLTRVHALSILKNSYNDEKRAFRRASPKHHFFKIQEIPESDLWEALLYCASIGDCFIVNNSFFRNALFVRKELASVFKHHFPRDNDAFKEQFRVDFEVDNEQNRKLALQMWTRNSSSMFKSSLTGLFTKQCAGALKGWKDIVWSEASPKSTVLSHRDYDVIWRDCISFFEDCGVLIPFFNNEDGSQSRSSLQWHILHDAGGLRQPLPDLPDDKMQVFYLLNVAPLSLIARLWTSLLCMRRDTRDSDEMLDCLLEDKNSNVIQLKRALTHAQGHCRLIVHDFPFLDLDNEDDDDFSSFSLRHFVRQLEQSPSTESLKHAGAILHVVCSKRDSALFRFCIEGVELALSTWYPDFSNALHMSCYADVPDSNQLLCLHVPLLPIFERNSTESLVEDRELPVSKVFPRTCSVFLSHVSESTKDGTSRFTDMLKDFLERYFICSVWYDKANMGQHSEFFEFMQAGLSQASTVIICLTPLYLTRPNCLRELRWALDLRDHYRKSNKITSSASTQSVPNIIFLALHPSMTYAGRQSIKQNRCVYLTKSHENVVPRKEDEVVVHMLSAEALALLERLDERATYNEFLSVIPWRSDFEDWSPDVSDVDLKYSEEVPTNVSEFFDESKKCSFRDLSLTFFKKFSEVFHKPPVDNSMPEFQKRYDFVFATFNSDDLNSNPPTRQSSTADIVQQFTIDKFFPKFLKMESSNFSKSLFEPKDMFLLILLGFSDAELVQLVELPISFREQGPANRLGAAIDSWLRKAALQSLYRELSDKMLEKLSTKQSQVSAHLVSSMGMPVLRTGRDRGNGSGFTVEKGPSELSMYTESISGLRRAEASVGSFSIAPSQGGVGVVFEKQLVQLLSTMNRVQEETNSRSLKNQEEKLKIRRETKEYLQKERLELSTQIMELRGDLRSKEEQLNRQQEKHKKKESAALEQLRQIKEENRRRELALQIAESQRDDLEKQLRQMKDERRTLEEQVRDKAECDPVRALSSSFLSRMADLVDFYRRYVHPTLRTNVRCVLATVIIFILYRLQFLQAIRNRLRK